GLYGPKAFLAGVARAEAAARAFSQLEAAARDEFLGRYHRDRLAAIEQGWSDDLRTAGGSAFAATATPIVASGAADPASAVAAGRKAIGKGRVEFPILRGTTTAPALARAQLYGATDDALWGRIAARHADAAKLDRGTLALMRAKNPSAFAAGR